MPDIHPVPRGFLISQDIGMARLYSKSLAGMYYTIVILKGRIIAA
ncbi:hypothetical protein CEV33_2145 [Brucella grignonensis]|uniref:Uncharacterized protein n=1 Tax=Brucella grignonensis TaxID=94627 RepID=A0A256F762_9HYPH|nr:hypothetical protein CEV33_2145 [Brucella grignonensis]